MKNNKFTSALLVAFMLLGFTAPGVSQNAQAQQQVQTDAQASTGLQKALSQIAEIKKQLESIEKRLSAVEEKVNNSGQSNSREVETQADAQTEAEAESQRRGPPAQAQNKDNLGSEVSAQARSGERQGIMSSISAWLANRGNNQAAEAVNSSPEERDQEESEREEDEREREEEGEIEIQTSGEIEAGNNVTLKSLQNGEAVANASVQVNGEVVGKTNAQGTITVTVPDSEEFEVEIETENAEGELEVELKSEEETENESEADAEADAEIETEAETDGSETSTESEAEAEAKLNLS